MRAVRPSSTALPARRVTAVVAALAVAATVALVVAAPQPAQASVRSNPLSGVYRGGADAPLAAQWERWRGKRAGVVMTFMPGERWSDLQVPAWFTRHWGGSSFRGRMVISMPMLPRLDSSATLHKGAAGAYNRHWRTAAQRLVKAGMGNAIIRPGWEFNIRWAKWNALGRPKAYAAYYRNIVKSMRSVPGAKFRFSWSVNNDGQPLNLRQAWPGNRYVDYVGVSAYNGKWGDAGATPLQMWAHNVANLKKWRTFARNHGKPIAIDEWGVVNHGASMCNGGCGGDDPYYIARMHQFLTRSNTAYEVYFERDASDGRHALMSGQFPRAASRYRSLFGTR